jgi:hypothetical protein
VKKRKRYIYIYREREKKREREREEERERESSLTDTISSITCALFFFDRKTKKFFSKLLKTLN